MLSLLFCRSHTKHHIKNLLELAKSDGFFHMNEYEFLLVVARKHGFSTSFIQKLEKKKNHKEFRLPQKARERFRYWYDLISMVLADNFIHEKELEFCERMAQKFGYPADFVLKTIEKIQEGRSYEEVFQTFSQEKAFI